VKLYFWPLKGRLRILGYPDASYRNNPDLSSQRGQCIFLAEARKSGRTDARGSLVDYESTKIRRTTLSTTVAELYSFMKCFGTCQFLRGLWMDVSGMSSDVWMRTDANNLVTTASTTHLPEQKETIHMIQMLRREACSGAIQDLAHVRTEFCLADCLTKHSASPDVMIKAVETGVLPQVDVHPLFREQIQHKAYALALPHQRQSQPQELPHQRHSSSQEVPHQRQATSGEDAFRDSWVVSDTLVERHHVQPRRSLFVPHNDHFPVSVATVMPVRTTYVQYLTGGSQVLEDSWNTSRGACRQLPSLWVGRTVFQRAEGRQGCTK
jgi:hypothetical protein